VNTISVSSNIIHSKLLELEFNPETMMSIKALYDKDFLENFKTFYREYSFYAEALHNKKGKSDLSLY